MHGKRVQDLFPAADPSGEVLAVQSSVNGDKVERLGVGFGHGLECEIDNDESMVGDVGDGFLIEVADVVDGEVRADPNRVVSLTRRRAPQSGTHRVERSLASCARRRVWFGLSSRGGQRWPRILRVVFGRGWGAWES